MNNLISVIVPVYNVQKYLDKCVQSLLCQTYKNLEIILVDDGSTDESGEVCDKLAGTDSRIQVIHKENGGLSDARNAGINVAKGDYIAFIDSDDWIEPNIIECALSSIKKTNSDIAIWGYVADFVDNNDCIEKSTVCCSKEIVCHKNENTSALLNQRIMGLLGYAWNKLYRSEIIDKIRFPKGISLVEDILFNNEVYNHAETIVLIDQIGTHYIQRQRETLGTKYYPNYLELKLKACNARKNIIKLFVGEDEKTDRFLANEYFGAIESTLRKISRDKNFCKAEKRNLINQTISKEAILNIILTYNAKGIKRKAIRFLIKIKCCSLIAHFYQIGG